METGSVVVICTSPMLLTQASNGGLTVQEVRSVRTPKSTYTITAQDTIIDKCLSYCTKFIIKYENYAEKPLVGQFPRVLGWEAAEGQQCVRFLVALLFDRTVKGRQGFSKQISLGKFKEHFNSLEWFKITRCRIQYTSVTATLGHNSLILLFRRQKLAVWVHIKLAKEWGPSKPAICNTKILAQKNKLKTPQNKQPNQKTLLLKWTVKFWLLVYQRSSRCGSPALGEKLDSLLRKKAQMSQLRSRDNCNKPTATSLVI